MTGTNRALRILGLFELSRPVITPEWLMKELNVSRASVYRDLGQLADAGMLERVADRGYVLGPKVVELDRQIRLADPLLEAAGGLLALLAEETGGAVLLCRFHGHKVLCIEQATSIKARAPVLTVSYERGRAMPLYRGATSKIILACLPLAQLKQLWAAERQALVAAGLPDDFAQFMKALRAIRDVGHYVTEGEVDPNAVGFAVPLRDGEHLLGSLSIVMPAATLTESQRKSTLSRLQSAAGRIEGRLQDQRMRARATRKAETS
jgi:DNA-binding IclR family transcriptional regulator